jgi:hypothetical protein
MLLLLHAPFAKVALQSPGKKTLPKNPCKLLEVCRFYGSTFDEIRRIFNLLLGKRLYNKSGLKVTIPTCSLIIDNNSGHSIKLIASSITLGTAYL